MTIKQALSKATKLLAKASRTPSLDAEVLLQFTLKIEKHKLFQDLAENISPRQLKRFNKLVARRKQSEPIAYLINNKEFFGLDFYVDKRVLIPRPETEILVEEALKIARKNKKDKPSIVDVGTGSGCIAVSLAKNLSNGKIFAIDKSLSALKVAKKNIDKHKLNSKIKLVRGNLLAPLKNRVDIIIANLPYLTLAKINATEESVRKYEPRMALLAGKKETTLYEKLLEQTPQYINKNGFILLEIDPLFRKETINLVKKYFPAAKISIKRDLAQKERVAIIKI